MPRTRTVVWAVIAVLVAALVLPFVVNVNRFSAQIAHELESVLGRRVTVGSVRLRLLGWPGFELQRVTIGDDPSFGAEPFARVPSVEATVRLRSLWTGRLIFSSLVFVEPSVNLARDEGGRWNVRSLLARAAEAAPRLREAPPYVELQDARINFRQGDVKTRFFLADVDAALYAERSSGRMRIRLGGTPARTDRILTGLGDLRAQGSFALERSPAASSPGKLAASVELTDAYLGDVLALSSGSDHGVHGLMDVRATIEAEPTGLRVTGSASVRDLHRWDLKPPLGSAPVEIKFDTVLDPAADSVDVRRVTAALSAGPFELSGKIYHLFVQPEVDLRARFEGASAATLLASAAYFIPQLPTVSRAAGLVGGDIRISGRRDGGRPITDSVAVRGFLRASELRFDSQILPGARLREARILLDGSRLSLPPALLELDRGRTINLAGNWDWVSGQTDFVVTGRDVPLATLAAASENAGLNFIPHFSASGADARASFQFKGVARRGARPSAGGWLQISRARWTPPGAAEAAIVHTAHLDIQPEQVRASRIVASWAGATITGTVRASLRGNGPPVYLADLRVDELDSGMLGAAMRPSPRAVGVLIPQRVAAASMPPPAARLRSEGQLAVGRLKLRGFELDDVRAPFRLSAGRLEFTGVKARLADGRFDGRARIALRGGAPEYEIEAKLQDIALDKLAVVVPRLEGVANGRAGGSLHATFAGWTSQQLLDSLRMRARIEGRDALLRNIDIEAAAGAAVTAGGASRVASFVLEGSVERRQVTLERAVLHLPAGSFQASGTVGFDYATDLEILAPAQAAGRPAALHSFRLTGPLDAPRSRPVEPARSGEGARSLPVMGRR